jgi:hypothetical protein
VRWERGRAIFTKWVAAYKLAADCTLGTGDAPVAMLQGLSETLHHIYLQEIDMAGGLMTQDDLVSLLQASAALYVLGLRSELKRLSFVRARTPLFGGYASYVILEHMHICSLMLYEIDLDEGVEYPDVLKNVCGSAALLAAASSVANSGSLVDWHKGDSWTVLSELIGFSAAFSW